MKRTSQLASKGQAQFPLPRIENGLMYDVKNVT